MSTEPVSESAFFTTIRSWGITRSDSRVFGGVLGGVGARIGMAPVPARIIFVVIAIFVSGPLLLAYAAAWALLPDSEGHIIIQDFGRGRPNVGSLVAIGILALIGFGLLGDHGLSTWWNFGYWELPFDSSPGVSSALGGLAFLVTVAVIGGIVAVIVWAVNSGRSTKSDRAAGGYARLPDGTIPVAPDAAPAPADATVSDATVADATVADAAGGTPPVYSGFANSGYVASGYAASAHPGPVPPPVYTAPPRAPRVPGPGKLGYLLALAWIPITAAITMYLWSTDQLAVFAVVAAGAIYVAGLGVILVITALRGRKLGFLGFVSVLALIPITLSIAYAGELREQYEEGSAWRGWVTEHVDGIPELESEPIYTPPPPFDPSQEFNDYDTVAIDGSCVTLEDDFFADFNGTVSLAAVESPQTITVTSTSTRLVVPTGTSIRVVPMKAGEMGTDTTVAWLDRDVMCGLNYGSTGGVTLTKAEAPVLTVVLDDVQQNGSMSLWIQEN